MLSVIVEGQRYPLDDGTYVYWMSDSGMGMPQVTNIISKSSLQHGSTWLDYRLRERVIRLVLYLKSGSLQSLYQQRDQLLRILAARNKPIILELDTGSKILRIDTYYHGGLDFPSTDRDGYSQNVSIDLLAPDPVWYSVLPSACTINLGGGGTGLAIPMSVPHSVGSSVANINYPINYYGSWDSYPHLVRITGPITDCKITNTATGDKLDFTGTTIADGTYYDIDLRWGYKTIKDNSGNNKLSKLTSDSNLSTWRLVAPIDGSLYRVNTINITGTGINANTKVDISYIERYIGV